jgi:hypothetical protein
LAVGLVLWLTSGMLVFGPWLGPASPWTWLLAVVVGMVSALLTAVATAVWWNRLLAQRLRSLHRLHAQDVEQWGGQALLSDHLAIEGLLEVMERENS